MSGSFTYIVKQLYHKDIPEEALIVRKNFLNVSLDKNALTFDNDVNKIILDNIRKYSTIEKFEERMIENYKFPLIMNLPIRYLHYVPVYSTTKRLNFRHFVVVNGMKHEQLQIYDSYVPSNPVCSMFGEVTVEESMAQDVDILQLNLSQNVIDHLINVKNEKYLFDELSKENNINVPWNELSNLINKLKRKGLRDLAYNLADSSVPAARIAMVRVVSQVCKSNNLFSVLDLWQKYWILFRVSLYKCSITGNKADLVTAQILLKQLKIQDRLLLSHERCDYDESAK